MRHTCYVDHRHI